MESEDGELVEKESEVLTVDFTKQSLKKIERASGEQQCARTLILDNNEIQRLDNLETYPNLKKLSVVNNQLIRMFGVSHLVQLVSLDLSSNSLVTIEGLKDMKELKYLNLARNRIKTIEHLNKNLRLEKLDLSENNIMHISDMSFLERLKELNLHGNRLTYLTQCEKNLPVSLEVLTLNNNSIADLNEISHLVQLTSLKELSIVNNPCLDFSEDQKFNYRPFVKNWCSSLVNLDNRPLDDIECLKAEWLYSQGRGRSFRPGEHAALIEYLISVCPKEAEENPEHEDVKKLKLILSKAQLHQQQLREQLSSGDPIKPPLPKKRTGLPERMVTSFQDSPAKDARNSPELMTRSLDSGMMRKSSVKIPKTEMSQTPLQTSTTFIPIPDTLISPDVGQASGAGCGYGGGKTSSISSRTSRSSSRNSPHSTPESKRKTLTSTLRRQTENTSPLGARKQGKLGSSRSGTPLESGSSPGRSLYSGSFPSDKRGVKLRESERNCRETSEDDDSEALGFKSKLVQPRASQRRLYKTQPKTNFHEKESVKERNARNLEKDLLSAEAWKAAVCIQRRWRGYRARNLSTEVLLGYKSIQMNRMQDYIMKVVADMEATRIALEGNRKLVILQMQAINALWKKMTAFQPNPASNSSETKASLQDLVETCSSLSKQVEGLQSIIKSMQASSSAPGSLVPMATQTEIVAVQTPQGEGSDKFPYNPVLKTVEGTTQIGSGDKELEEEEEENDDEEEEEAEDGDDEEEEEDAEEGDDAEEDDEDEMEEVEVRQVDEEAREEPREESRENAELTENPETVVTEDGVKELYTNCNAQGSGIETSTPASHSESTHDHGSLYLGGHLEKPCAKLSNETITLGPTRDHSEESKDEPESPNSST